MTSASRIKGYNTQRKAIKELESQGWKVGIVERNSKFAKERDLWGLFDAIAIKKNITLYLQFATNRPHRHGDYESFSELYSGPNVLVEQWIWYDRKGWKIFKYYQGERTKEDLRK